MKSTLVYILGIVWLLTGCMAQQEVTVLDGRVAALEKQSARVVGQDARLDANDKQVRDIRRQVAGTAADLERLREELELMRGNLEVTEHQVAKKLSAGDDVEAKRKMELERLEAQLVAANQKIDRILQYLNLAGSGEAGATQPETAPAAVSLSDRELYGQAKKAYDSGNLEDARQGFMDLLKQHPKSKNADNAQFWIGETYYREKWFEKAILEYQKVIEKYPKGNKVPASRLKQGLAFSNLGDKTNARLILQELIKKHPQSNEAKIAAKKLKKLK
ncbi:MAG: Cell division coordinator CpoB [Olavius algarvensis Delta 4 endosymbiont]|nr:MAG: Cell division coordinator CpoB [Olavius algarvensis Delta 4 endosymbiont]